MSERNCAKCVNGSTVGLPQIKMSHMPCQYLPDECPPVVAAICKHYEERVEPTAQCGVACRASGKNGGLVVCCLRQGHSGRHWAELTPTASLFWDGPDPTPTAFDKAWKSDEKKLGLYPARGDLSLYRAGWQARGKALNDKLSNESGEWMPVSLAIGINKRFNADTD